MLRQLLDSHRGPGLIVRQDDPRATEEIIGPVEGVPVREEPEDRHQSRAPWPQDELLQFAGINKKGRPLKNWTYDPSKYPAQQLAAYRVDGRRYIAEEDEMGSAERLFRASLAADWQHGRLDRMYDESLDMARAVHEQARARQVQAAIDEAAYVSAIVRYDPPDPATMGSAERYFRAEQEREKQALAQMRRRGEAEAGIRWAGQPESQPQPFNYDVQGLPLLPELQQRRLGIRPPVNKCGGRQRHLTYEPGWSRDLEGRYRMVQQLGEGADAITWLAEPRDNQGRLVCVKVGKEGPGHHFIRNEIEILDLLGHDAHRNIISLLDVDRANYRWTVIPYLETGELATLYRKHAKGCNPSIVWHLLEELVGAVAFLHSNRPPVAHGDLHDLNIMLDSTDQQNPCFLNLRIIDFGRAAVGPGARPSSAASRVSNISTFEDAARADVVSVGMLFHSLAHISSLQCREDAFPGRNGWCRCKGVYAGSAFGEWDEEYSECMRLLSMKGLRHLAGPDAQWVVSVARRRRAGI